MGSAHTRQDLANTDTKGYGRSSLEGPDGSALATRIAPGRGEWGASAPQTAIMRTAADAYHRLKTILKVIIILHAPTLSRGPVFASVSA